MRYLVISIALLFSTFCLAESTPRYKKGDLSSAKNLAKVENKLVFVKFYADWCLPCKWMDETTFSDPTVLGKLDDHFISMKVNIDDFDGYDLKEELKVKVLPTMIIYDTKGKMIKRIEEPLPSSKMHKLLDEVITSDGGEIKRKVNQSPNSFNSAQNKQQIQQNYQRKSYKLQLGVFNGFENTMNFLERVKEKINEQAMVLHDYKDGKTMYKVLIGKYQSHKEASMAKHKLKTDHGLDSVIY